MRQQRVFPPRNFVPRRDMRSAEHKHGLPMAEIQLPAFTLKVPYQISKNNGQRRVSILCSIQLIQDYKILKTNSL